MGRPKYTRVDKIFAPWERGLILETFAMADGNQLDEEALLAAYRDFERVGRLCYAVGHRSNLIDLPIFPWRNSELPQRLANAPIFREEPGVRQLLEQIGAIPLEAVHGTPPPETRGLTLLTSLGSQSQVITRAISDSQCTEVHIISTLPDERAAPLVDQVKKTVSVPIAIHPVAQLSLGAVLLLILRLIQKSASDGRRSMIHFGGGSQAVSIALLFASYFSSEHISDLFYYASRQGAITHLPTLSWRF
jgi:hypothetical protein